MTSPPSADAASADEHNAANSTERVAAPLKRHVLHDLGYVIAAHPIAEDTRAAPALNQYVASKLDVSEGTAGLVAWQLLMRAVKVQDEPNEPDELPDSAPKRAFLAARHLLGLVEYVRDERGRFDRNAIITDDTVSASYLHALKIKGTPFYPFDPIATAGQRRLIAGRIGGWTATDRSRLAPRRGGHQLPLRELAGAVWEVIAHDLVDPQITGPLVDQALIEEAHVKEMESRAAELAEPDDEGRPILLKEDGFLQAEQCAPTPADGLPGVAAERAVPHRASTGPSELSKRPVWRDPRALIALLVLAAVVATGVVVLVRHRPDPDVTVSKDDLAGLVKPEPPQENVVGYWKAGWGPKREMFKLDSGGAPYATFNSISDNPNIGDERNFVGLRRTDAVAGSTWSDDVWAKPGDTFHARAYVNNAGTDSNGSVSAGWIQGARLQMGLSEGKREFSVFGILSGSNATTVWDGATIHTDDGVDVILDSTSAKVENNAAGSDGRSLPASLFGPDGAPLGYKVDDGVIKPGYKYAEYVTVTLRVVKAETAPESSSRPETAAAPSDGYRGGWGPERETFTTARPASYTVLNSITDNPAHLDERNFVQIRPLGQGNDAYTDLIRGEVGDEFVVFAYVANDAADNFTNATGAVHGLAAQLYLPPAGNDLSLAIRLKGKNAAEVWDGASIITSSNARIEYVPQTAIFHSAGVETGNYEVDDAGFRTGRPMTIGYEKADGVLPVGLTSDGVEKGVGFLTFRVRVVTR